MKNKLTLFIAVLFVHFASVAQNTIQRTNASVKQQALVLTREDSLDGFDLKDGLEHAAHLGYTGKIADAFIEEAKRKFIIRKFNLDRPKPSELAKGAPGSVTALNCTTDNFDFEQGSLAGWTTSGNCGLMSSGTDVYGGFPNVCPLAGAGNSYSLKLSSDLSSGCCASTATKSIPVPTGQTTYFTFYFALAIYNYPHTAAEAATFSVNFYDQNGALIPCPQFLCYHSSDNGDVGVTNFASTTYSAQVYNPNAAGDITYGSNVTYAPWQPCTADLTPYAGTTISAVFTVKWCVYSVDWLYALIDASCPTNYTPPTSTCVSLPYNLAGPPNMQTYTWTAPGGATSYGSSVNATTAGVYTVTCQPKLDCGSSTATYTYNIQPIPTANFTSNLPSCSSNLTVTDNSTLNGTTIASYSWDYGDGSTGTGNPGTHTYPTTPGTYNVTETVTTTQGCSASVTHPVTISNPLALNVNSGSICSGSSLVLTATGGATSYSWSGPNLSGTTGATVTASPTTTTVYTVTGVNGTCTNTATSTVTVGGSLAITAGNNSPLCTGQTLNLTSTAGATYTWTGPGGFTSNSQNPSITNVSAANAGVYSVTVTDISGCQGTGTTTVTISPALVITATGTTVCTGSTINLSSTAGGAVYAWSGPNSFTSSVQNPSIANSTTAMTGVYSVTVTNTGGCVGTATTQVTVNPLPVPTATNNSPVCVNQTLNFTGGGGTSYAWNGPNGFTSPTQNPFISNVTTAATGVYTVVVTDANSCQAVTTTTVVINSLPVVTVSGSTVCTNATINLTSGGGTGYSWSGPGGYVSNIQNPTLTNAQPSMSGVYTVTVTDANTCVNSNTTTVVVNANPVITAGSNAPCQGFALNLTATGAVAWSWNGPGGFTSSSQNPTLPNATTSMNGAYSVTGTDINGCIGSTTINITVNPLPNPTIGSNSPVCVNQTLNLNSGGGTGYSWSGPNGFASSAQNPTITGVSTAAAGTYTVTVTDANGCVNSTTIATVINPLPIVTVAGSTVCLNNTISLSANGGVGYSWSGPGGYSSNSQNPTIPNATLANAGSYVATVTDANNCVNANVAQVVVNNLPTVTANSGAICVGSITTLTASGAVNYAWSPTTGLSASVGTTVNASPATTTPYTVTGTDANGCQSSGTLTVTVNPIPPVSISPQNSSGCAPVCTSFSNTAASSGNCSWNFGDGTTSTSCNPNHCFTGQGTFSSVLTLTDANGCVNTATATVVVFPNPAADFYANPQPTTILDPNIQFTNASSGAVITSYTWTLNDPNHTVTNVQNPATIYPDAGEYPVLLIVKSDHGCIDSTIKIIKIDDEFAIYVPNAFSPNGDGVNETFFAKGMGIKDFKMYIFDRWGEQVFFSDDIYKGWDGRFQSKGTDIVQEDVYVWKILVHTFRGEAKMFKGHVSLIK
ncbi:MAG: PKD domain-containing protein [Bacteroidia bacterium]